jgi:hypothetical protein
LRRLATTPPAPRIRLNSFSGLIRAYSLLQLLTILAGYWFLRSLWERRAADWWEFIGVLVLLMYAHYYMHS